MVEIQCRRHLRQLESLKGHHECCHLSQGSSAFSHSEKGRGWMATGYLDTNLPCRDLGRKLILPNQLRKPDQEMGETLGEFHVVWGRTKWGSARSWKSDSAQSREIIIIRVMAFRFMYQQRSSLISRSFARITSLISPLYPFCCWRTISQGDVVTNLASQNESNPDIRVPGSTEVCAGQRAGHFSPCHLGGTQSKDWGHPQLWGTHSRPLWRPLSRSYSTAYIFPPWCVKAIKFSWLH